MKLSFTLGLCLMCVMAFAQVVTSDVATLLDRKGKVDCIIVMQDQLDMYGQTNGLTKEQKAQKVFTRLNQHAARSQATIIQYLQSEQVSYQSYYVFNGIQAVLNTDQVKYIVDHFDVKQVAYNQPAVALEDVPTTESVARMDVEWGIAQIKADSVWQLGYEGAGVVIGGQDTGYDFDNALILPRYRGYSEDTIDHSYNWHDAIDSIDLMHEDEVVLPTNNPCGLSSLTPCDDHGHGTHTMGTMVGRDSTNFIGVAPAAQWIGCRNMERGYGKPSTYTECFEWFLAPTDINNENADPTKAPHIINNSWGCTEDEGCNLDNWVFMETVVNNLTAAGILVVVSAGNDGWEGCGSIFNPATVFENSFTVGATNSEDGLAYFSSIGPVNADGSNRIKPDIVAPGVQVRSITLNDQFASWDGTSMAGPHVAGAAALIINANPELAGQVDEIKDIIQNSALRLTGEDECFGISANEVPNFLYGYGRIDALAAVEQALNFSSTDELLSADEIKVFPNPNMGSFTILNETNSIDQITISDMAGKLVYSNSFVNATQQIEIAGLTKGMYIYSLKSQEGIAQGKIVVVE